MNYCVALNKYGSIISLQFAHGFTPLVFIIPTSLTVKELQILLCLNRKPKCKYLHSEGCASAVKRILTKIDGVTNIETNVTTKSVIVTHGDSVSPTELLDKLTKWSQASGKSVTLIS